MHKILQGAKYSWYVPEIERSTIKIFSLSFIAFKILSTALSASFINDIEFLLNIANKKSLISSRFVRPREAKTFATGNERLKDEAIFIIVDRSISGTYQEYFAPCCRILYII